MKEKSPEISSDLEGYYHCKERMKILQQNKNTAIYRCSVCGKRLAMSKGNEEEWKKKRNTN